MRAGIIIRYIHRVGRTGRSCISLLLINSYHFSRSVAWVVGKSDGVNELVSRFQFHFRVSFYGSNFSSNGFLSCFAGHLGIFRAANPLTRI